MVGNDEVAQYQHEFVALCDRLNVCEEIREGYYSDEARMVDLFDFIETAEDMDKAVTALGLPGITAVSYLVDALQAVREHWATH